MNLWFRLLRVLIMARFARKQSFLEPAELTFRVWPTDLDVNVHMTNSRYYSVMDLGRVDLTLRTRLGDYVLKKRLNMIVGGALTRHRYALNPWQKFKVVTQMLGWDDRWIYMLQQTIDADGRVACSAMFRGGFLENNEKMVPPAVLMKESGENLDSPALPDWIATWNDVDKQANA